MKNARTCFAWILGLSVVLVSGEVWAAPVTGIVRERGTRTPLAGVSVFVLPHRLKAETDPKGGFQFPDVPEGPFQFVVNIPGYLRLERNVDSLDLVDLVDLVESVEPRFELFVEKNSYQVYETTVYGKENRRDQARKTLTRKQFEQAPGGLGDPVRAVQNLSGVGRPAGFSSQVLIQGSGPQETRYTFNGHEVPLVFHFGGLSSVVVPDAVDRVDVLQAGYGPEFGRATGGLVGLWTRPPRTDRWHGLAFVDLLNAGFLLEGPLSESTSLLVSARQSYVGLLLKAVASDSEDFNLTVVPGFRDSTLTLQSELTERDRLTINALASQDTLDFLLKQPVKQDPSIRGEFSSSTGFFRIIPQWTHEHSERTVSRHSFGLGRDFIRLSNNANRFELKTWALTTRGELERKLDSPTTRWTSAWGYDNRYSWADVNLSLPDTFSAGGVANPISTGTRRSARIEQENHKFGFYWRNEIKPNDSPWTFLPSARLDYFQITRETLPAPRLASRYLLFPGLELRSAAGLYYQPPQEQEVDAVFGNPAIRSPRAWHATLGAERDFRGGLNRGFVLGGDLFYKRLERLIVPSSRIVGAGQPENFTNEGSGSVIGAQWDAKYNAEPWELGAIYTLSRSRRFEPRSGTAPAPFDQTHLLGVVGAYTLGNWRFSGRFRYSTGNPYTPVRGGVFDSDNDVYVPVRGPYFSERLDPFYQLDLRIDRKWVFDRWILSAYLDIQNVTNRKNPESIIYSYNYAQRDQISGLPILPTLGVKGEF